MGRQVSRGVPFMHRVTAKDVATRAGVSVATVSLVVNDKADGRVTEQTRRRVLRAVESLGYRLNASARSLAMQQPGAIAIVCPELTNPFYALLLDGLSEVIAGRYALNLVVPGSMGDYDTATILRAMEMDLAGLILAAPGNGVLTELNPYCPTLVLDSPGTHRGFPAIDLDVTHAGRELARHLTEQGHRRVAYIGSVVDKASFRRRREGLASGLLEHGATLLPNDLLVDRVVMEAAEAGFPQAWQEWERAGVTAVVCADDVLAYGVLASAARLNLGVPADVAVAAYNDLPMSSLTSPPLTSVAFPARELGIQAGEALLSYIEVGGPPRNRTLPTRLVPRASTARP
ncbi:MAG: LacI family transcriptional regulator [Streptosporangiaceae bacterium]|jgi:LacI family transcriptional regulator|nr:LacI family transcriptional regulator [Streptosporangiaceae bacterium]